MKLIKKSLSILIALILVFTAMPVFAEEAQTVNVVATFDKNSVEAGDDVTLTFSFDQKVENVSSFTFYVEYDEDLFTYDKDKSHMPEGYNTAAGTVSYQEDTPKANTAKFGFMHISPEEAAFDGNDDYKDDFYYMVFTANADVDDTSSAEFKLNAPGTAMLTYTLDGDDLGNIDNEVTLTVNDIAAGTYGNNVNIEITPKQGGTSEPWEGDIVTDWYSTEATEFVITTPAQLAGLAAIVNGTADGIAQDDFSGKTVNLKADLDLGNNNWTPIGRRTSRTGYVYFAGCFDGEEHEIKNLYIDYDIKGQTNPDGSANKYVGCVGLFGVVGTSENRSGIKNLALYGEYK